MPGRSYARKRALDILYEAEFRGVGPDVIIRERVAAAEPPVAQYTVELVEGVTARAERIDELITAHAVGWTLARMPAVDRNALRLGTYELLYSDDVPDPVAINEAVRLVGELSTDDSPSFVNGLLAKLLDIKPTLVEPQ